jgi:general secretion pathway protein D
VLGGLIKDDVTESVSGYPYLSDIPIIGWLFKNKTTKKTKSNLLVVITPYVVRGRTDFARIFQRKYAEHKAYQDMVYADSSEYRAYVDYSKKTGPLALMHKAVKHELEKAENGGKGEAGDVIVMPSGNDMTEPVKSGSKPAEKTAPQKPLPPETPQPAPESAPLAPEPPAAPPSAPEAPANNQRRERLEVPSP